MKDVKITKKETKKLASLSKIGLTDEEIEKLSGDMDTIISSVDTLNKFEQETGLEIKTRKLDEIEFEELREDKVEKGLSRDEVLSNAPYVEDGYVKIHGNVLDDSKA
jgi:aspartyl-tRNA(Asn)/glutamyl-tRNA(Gln) amidotransferase subunit C